MESYSKEIYISASHAVGTIAHEILHSLGFFHEQNRPNRDQYINVYLDRIPYNDKNTRYQYQINPLAKGVGIFDFNSIMMYSSNGIMEKKNGQEWQRQRDSLSLGDIEGLAHLYGPPSSICNSGIYTVTSGTSVTLQYATNIANVTSLGNNQYRITRIGNANGTVTLKSLLNGNAYTKDIVIGIPISPTSYIIGQASINSPSQGYSLYPYQVDAVPGNTYQWNVSGMPGVLITEQSNNSIVLAIPRIIGNSSKNISLSVKASNQCGESLFSFNKTITVTPNNGGGINGF